MQRRTFFINSVALAVTETLFAQTNKVTAELPAKPLEDRSRKIKVGFVGGGGRGHWIAGLFKAHGGYEAVAVADYFQPVADKLGDVFGVARDKRFSGLSGYKRVIESGIEALVIEDVPYFYPEQAAAAVAAGLHVYIAKPVAVDVPGTLAIGEAGKAATQKERVFLVDYQIPTDPFNSEVAQRIQAGGLGPLAQVQTYGLSNGFSDPPKTDTIESRLKGLIWVNDVALGCDNIGNYDIHAIDAAIWVLKQRPISAVGTSRSCRKEPHGDGRDVISLVYEYADGVIHNHYGTALKNNSESILRATFAGRDANAQIIYAGKAFLRGGSQHYGGGTVENLYKAGAERNIASFYRDILNARYENETVPRAVDGTLACILGREAAARGCKLTMKELLAENRKLDVDLKGLKD